MLVPFFEKNLRLRKYLYNFNKDLVYNSETSMKKRILSLINKEVSFPLNSNKYKKTIQYYLGKTKNTEKKYLNFLNN